MTREYLHCFQRNAILSRYEFANAPICGIAFGRFADRDAKGVLGHLFHALPPRSCFYPDFDVHCHTIAG